MKLLMDTQCWLWWFAQSERLNEEAIAKRCCVRPWRLPLGEAQIAHIADKANELWFSVASVWEIGIKVAIGKLPLPEPIDSYISRRL